MPPVIKAKFAGYCPKCQTKYSVDTSIVKDTAANKWVHETCPRKTQTRSSLNSSGGSKGNNRKPGFCERCGEGLQPGQGQLDYCIEDSSCRIHFDHPGYHLRCLDENECKRRSKEKAEKRKLQQEEARLEKAKKEQERQAYIKSMTDHYQGFFEAPCPPPQCQPLCIVDLPSWRDGVILGQIYEPGGTYIWYRCTDDIYAYEVRLKSYTFITWFYRNKEDFDAAIEGHLRQRNVSSPETAKDWITNRYPYESEIVKAYILEKYGVGEG